MIRLKATCKACEGTGYALNDCPFPCPECGGVGIQILTAEKWDIELERVPPFGLEGK